MGQGELWAVTCIFSPVPSNQRLRNFALFRERLELPVLVAELGFDAHFSVQSQDADIVLQFKDGDRLWQKERLFNLAIRYLPPSCRTIVFLDADVLMTSPTWASETQHLLDEYDAVQPFGDAVFVPLEEAAEADDWNSYRRTPGFARLLPRTSPSCSPGGAWAFRRDFIERFGFYDACVVGGGDTALATALANMPEHFLTVAARTEEQAEHYRAWAAPVAAATQGRVGCLESNDLVVIEHGNPVNRQYVQRHSILLKHSFDPANDLVAGHDGCWQWNGKPQLAEDVLEYFRSRSDDNPHAAPAKPARPFVDNRKRPRPRPRPFLPG